jgi:AcrR family transcriptional regulator
MPPGEGNHRGPYKAGVRRRQQIIESADIHFANEGYHETPLSTIAAEVGITDAGLLHHFPSKLHLLIAVSEHNFARSNKNWQTIGADPSFLEILASMCRTTYSSLEQHSRIELDAIAAAEAISGSGIGRDDYAEGLHAAITGTTNRFRHCLARGELHSWVDPEALARQCFAIGNGLNMQWVLSNRAFDLGEANLQGLSMLALAVSPGPYPPSGPSELIRELARRKWPT